MRRKDDFYSILGVSRHASQTDITQAFRKLAKTHHPDVGTLPPDQRGDHDFPEMNAAYDTLKDPDKRELYDREQAEANSLVAQTAAIKAKPRVFAGGLVAGFLVALIGIGAVVKYPSVVGLSQPVEKTRESLSSKRAENASLARVASENRSVATEVSPVPITVSAETSNKAVDERSTVTSSAPSTLAAVPVDIAPEKTVQIDQDTMFAAESEINTPLGKVPAVTRSSAQAMARRPREIPTQNTSDALSDSDAQGTSSARETYPDALAAPPLSAPKRVAAAAKPTQTQAAFILPQPQRSEFIELVLAAETELDKTSDKNTAYRLVALVSSATREDELLRAAAVTRRIETWEMIRNRLAALTGKTHPDMARAPASQSSETGIDERDVSATMPAPKAVSSGQAPDFIDVATGSRSQGLVTRLRPGQGRNESVSDCKECPEMVAISAGTYTMGSKLGDRAQKPEELPAHRVTIDRSILVSKLKISTSQWRACVIEGGCKASRVAPLFNRPQMHAARLSWNDTKDYVAWLVRKTGKAYRLLSEAEWEFVALSGTVDPELQSDETEWRGYSQRRIRLVDLSQTLASQSFSKTPANRWGVQDLLGGPAEWTEDCWHPNYTQAPGDGSAWRETNAGRCGQRVIRGGSITGTSAGSRPTARAFELISVKTPSVAVRVAREIRAQESGR